MTVNRNMKTIRNQFALATIAACLIAANGGIAFADVTDGCEGEPYIDLGRGPVYIHIPSGYDPEVPTPLLLGLHSYGGLGEWFENYAQFEPLIDEYGFFYLHPDGTVDDAGNQFWNATDACCDIYGSGVDDSGYLLALIDEMKILYNIDDQRVYLTGLSNGAFMCYRMACDHADTIAAIASLSGVTFYDPADCTPSAPVHVLHIHGTADNQVLYGGGVNPVGVPYPGAVETVETWAAIYNGCELIAETLPPLDLDASIPGDETVVTQYATGCEPGGSAELWSIVGGAHVPVLSENYSTLVIEFLLSHSKPDACPADINGDDTVDVLDLLALLAAWANLGGPEDINGDGVVDVLDLLEVLAAWGPCP